MSESVFKQVRSSIFITFCKQHHHFESFSASPSKPTDSWVVPLGAVRLLWTPTRPTHNCRHTARLSFEPSAPRFPSSRVAVALAEPLYAHMRSHTLPRNDHAAACQPPLCLVASVCARLCVFYEPLFGSVKLPGAVSRRQDQTKTVLHVSAPTHALT